VTIALLRLLHIGDSALPIGSASHSFGLETLASDGVLTPSSLEAFLREYLRETGVVDAALCAAGHRLAFGNAANDGFEVRWVELCDVASALKPARESRDASAVLGRRLLQLVASLEPHDVVDRALDCAHGPSKAAAHYPAAFGLAAAALGIDRPAAVFACLHQSLTGLISACQRTMPVGQFQASRTLWDLKPDVAEAAERGLSTDLSDVRCFAPLVDVGSMRHRRLPTRLFIS
jgi:urease accessory protein